MQGGTSGRTLDASKPGAETLGSVRAAWRAREVSSLWTRDVGNEALTLTSRSERSLLLLESFDMLFKNARGVLERGGEEYEGESWNELESGGRRVLRALVKVLRDRCDFV